MRGSVPAKHDSERFRLAGALARASILQQKSRQGRPKIAHRFNGGNQAPRTGKAPLGAKETTTYAQRVLSSLAGLAPTPPTNPALKRWAILFRPAGWPERAEDRPAQSNSHSATQP